MAQVVVADAEGLGHLLKPAEITITFGDPLARPAGVTGIRGLALDRDAAIQVVEQGHDQVPGGTAHVPAVDGMIGELTGDGQVALVQPPPPGQRAFRRQAAAFELQDDLLARYVQPLVVRLAWWIEDRVAWLEINAVATDLNAARLERARQIGALTVNGAAADAADQIRTLAGGPVDIAVEASASHAGARLLASLLRWPHAYTAEIAYRAGEGPCLTNYWPRLCLLASYTKKMDLWPSGLTDVEGALVLHPRDRRVQDRLAVIDRIRAGALKTADFVGAPVPVGQAPEVYRMLRDEPAKALSCVLSWE